MAGTEPDDILPPPSERVVLWYRAAPCEDAALAAERAGAVATRCEVAGGVMLARIGQAVVASFDTIDLEDTIELGLSMLAELRTGGDGAEPAAQPTLALALGEVRMSPGLYEGAALDRAQLLANRARPGELIIDEPAHELTEDTHLCMRSLRAGHVRGHVVDARFPLKRDCRAALSKLHPPQLPEVCQAPFERLRHAASAEGTRRIVLQSAQPYTAMDWVRRLAASERPPLLLHLGRVGGGLQPLGGLSLALRRLGDALDGIELDAARRATLVAIRSGAAVSRTDARKALRALLAARPGSWIVLDRLRELDTPSLLVIADATREQERDLVLFLAVGDADGVPSALLRAGEHERLVLPTLDAAAARQVAEQVLGSRSGADVTRRLAQLGGDTLLGIDSAARTLVCSGDLVFAEGAFRWRTGPRNASVAIPTDALLSERIHGLDAEAQRALEALCVTPPAMGLSFVERVAELDGLSSDQVRSGMGMLLDEGWVNGSGELGPLSPMVRGAVRNEMPPARAAELHRFVAQVLTDVGYGGLSFGSALLARHLAEGGREVDAAAALLDTAQAATDGGFERMAVRLAAFALKLDDGPELKARARRVAKTVDSRPATRSALAEHAARSDAAVADAGGHEDAQPSATTIAEGAVRAAIEAIVGGEPEAAEDFLDTAVAAGWGQAGAQRLWSLALLAKGDVPAAVRTFKQARRPDADAATRRREALTAALILLEAGELLAAIRSALEALSDARAEADEQGTRAAMLVLSGCYRCLGREQDAARIEATAYQATA